MWRKFDGEVGLGILSYQKKSNNFYFHTTIFSAFCWFWYLFIFSLNDTVVKSVSFCRHIFCTTYFVKKTDEHFFALIFCRMEAAVIAEDWSEAGGGSRVQGRQSLHNCKEKMKLCCQ